MDYWYYHSCRWRRTFVLKNWENFKKFLPLKREGVKLCLTEGLQPPRQAKLDTPPSKGGELLPTILKIELSLK